MFAESTELEDQSMASMEGVSSTEPESTDPQASVSSTSAQADSPSTPADPSSSIAAESDSPHTDPTSSNAETQDKDKDPYAIAANEDVPPKPQNPDPAIQREKFREWWTEFRTEENPKYPVTVLRDSDREAILQAWVARGLRRGNGGV